MHYKPISKIFKEVSEVKTYNDRLEKLRENDNPFLRTMLKNIFDPKIKFLLPRKMPPGLYKASKFNEPLALYAKMKKLYIFIDGQSPVALEQNKREKLFIRFLECLRPEEADVVVAMLDKKSSVPHITYKLVTDAFPGLIDVE